MLAGQSCLQLDAVNERCRVRASAHRHVWRHVPRCGVNTAFQNGRATQDITGKQGKKRKNEKRKNEKRKKKIPKIVVGKGSWNFQVDVAFCDHDEVLNGLAWGSIDNRIQHSCRARQEVKLFQSQA